MAGRVGPINILKNAVAAYSLRRLTSEYLGSAIRVRRSSDNSETDIGFTSNGELDSATLLSFASGSNNAFVSLWYDQTGFDLHQVRTESNQQPQIVSNGSLITDSGKPAIYLNGTATLTSITPTNRLTSPFGEWSSFGVFRYLDISVIRVLFSSDFRPTHGNRVGQFLRSGANVGKWSAIGFRNDNSFANDSGAFLSTNQVILNSIRSINAVEIFTNGVSDGPSSLVGNAAAGLTNFLDIGYRGGINNTFAFQPFGYVHELIHYNTDLTCTYKSILNQINNYYKVF